MIYKNSAIFDFETCGLHAITDPILEVAALRIRDGNVVGVYHELANPGRLVPPEITRITGITSEMVASCTPIDDVIANLMLFVGTDSLLIGHNVAFDLGFLEVNLQRLFAKTVPNHFLDTRAMCIKRFPYKSHRLASVCEYLDIKLDGAHRALNDVMATWEVCKMLWDEANIADPQQGMEWYIDRVLHFRKYAHDPPFIPEHGTLELVG